MLGWAAVEFVQSLACLLLRKLEDEGLEYFAGDEGITRQSANREARFPISRRVGSPGPRSVVLSVGLCSSLSSYEDQVKDWTVALAYHPADLAAQKVVSCLWKTASR